MTTDTELAKKLFRRSLGSGSSALSNTGGEGSQPTDIRWGTVVAVNADSGTITVELDITGVNVEVYAEGVEYQAGDRVALIWQGNRWVIVSNEAQGRNLQTAQDKLLREITEKGEDIRADVESDIAEVEDNFNEFKENHQWTDDDIKTETTKIVGGEIRKAVGTISDGNTTLTSSKTIYENLESLQLELSTDYVSKDGYSGEWLQIYNKLGVTADSSWQAMGYAAKAISGALKSANSYTDSSAELFRRDFISFFVDKMQQQYGLSSSFWQNAEGIEATATKALSYAQANYYATCTTGANVQTKVAQINSIATGEDFKLYNGVVVNILFSHGNTADYPSLKIKWVKDGQAKETSAYSMRYSGNLLNSYVTWNSPTGDGVVVTCVFTNNSWELTDNPSISANMRFDANGITVGGSTTNYRTRMAPSRFEILNPNDAVAAYFGANQVALNNGNTLMYASGTAHFKIYSPYSQTGELGLDYATDNPAVPYMYSGFTGTKARYGGLATNTGMDNRIEALVAGKVLYGNESGTTKSISISGDSFLDYRFLEFVYGDDKNRMATKRVHIKQVKDRAVTLDRIIRASDGVVFVDTSVYTISTTTLSKNQDYSGRAIIAANGTCSTDKNSTVIIYYVIGWR